MGLFGPTVHAGSGRTTLFGNPIMMCGKVYRLGDSGNGQRTGGPATCSGCKRALRKRNR
jgi:hypothetical protein